MKDNETDTRALKISLSKFRVCALIFDKFSYFISFVCLIAKVV